MLSDCLKHFNVLFAAENILTDIQEIHAKSHNFVCIGGDFSVWLVC